jgi:hypothetical protein
MARLHPKEKKKKNPISARAVVEGSNEAWYLQRLKSLGLLPSDVDIKPPDNRTNAQSIVNKAIKLLESSNIEESTVYSAVFDRELSNEPASVFEDLDNQLKPYKDRIIPIVSSPTFEYVLYSHFKFSDAQKNYENALKNEKQISYAGKDERSFKSFCDSLEVAHVESMQTHLKKIDRDCGFDATTSLRKRAEQEKMPNSNFYLLMEASGVVS